MGFTPSQGCQSLAHLVERLHQDGAWAAKVQPYKALAALAKGVPIVQGHPGSLQKRCLLHIYAISSYQSDAER